MSATPTAYKTKDGRLLSYSPVLAKFAREKGLTPVFEEQAGQPHAAHSETLATTPITANESADIEAASEPGGDTVARAETKRGRKPKSAE